jgi:hypothetical protein
MVKKKTACAVGYGQLPVDRVDEEANLTLPLLGNQLCLHHQVLHQVEFTVNFFHQKSSTGVWLKQ